MRVKIHSVSKSIKAIPAARVKVLAREPAPSERALVIVHVSVLDAHEIPEVFASLRLSIAEAREIAARLLAEASAAEALESSAAEVTP